MPLLPALGQPDLEPALQQFLRPGNDLIRIQLRRKFQLIQELLVVAADVDRLAQDPTPVGAAHAIQQPVIVRLTAKLSQPAPGVALPEPGQHRPVLLLPVEDAVLQPQPEQPLVLVPVLLLLKGGEDLLQSGPVIVTAHRPDDDIPIQLRLSVGIIGLEIRLKGIAPGRVPDDVHGPALLQL